ncbi:hypothetical protein BN1263160037 [Stenotrophomonas maltophilia]|nr:hypothetical protein BN1263160037 [Stenotrophomonas maltophilia]
MRDLAGRRAQDAVARLRTTAGRRRAFYHLTLPQIRQGALALAGHTGWGLHEIMTLRVSKFIWWIQGLPVHGQ